MRSLDSWNQGLVRPPEDEQPRLDPFPAQRDVHLMQMRPELVLGDAGPQHLAHLGHAGLAGRDGDVHAGDLVGGFDRARQLHHLLPVEDLDAGLLQQVGAQRLQLVDGDALVAAAAARDQLQDLRRPDLGDFLAARPGVEIIPAAGGPHLGDGLEPVGEMLAIMEVEEGDRPLGRDIAIARRRCAAPRPPCSGCRWHSAG